MKKSILTTTSIALLTLFIFSCGEIDSLSSYELLTREPWIIETLNGESLQECAADDTYDFKNTDSMRIHYEGTPCFGLEEEFEDGTFYFDDPILIMEYSIGPFFGRDSVTVKSISKTRLIWESPATGGGFNTYSLRH